MVRLISFCLLLLLCFVVVITLDLFWGGLFWCAIGFGVPWDFGVLRCIFGFFGCGFR